MLYTQSGQRIRQQRLRGSTGRTDHVNHACQPLSLSVWSLGLTSVWWSLTGNELLLQAASIIHTYESTICLLILGNKTKWEWANEGEGKECLLFFWTLSGISVVVISFPAALHLLWSASLVPAQLDSREVTRIAHYCMEDDYCSLSGQNMWLERWGFS